VRRDAREIVTATLVVAAVLGGFLLLYRFRVVVFLLLAAFVINVAITPAVNWLVASGRSRPLAVALIYLALLTAISLFVILVGPMLVNQVSNFSAKIPEYYRSGRELLIASPNYVLRRVALIAPVQLIVTPPVETDEQALAQAASFLAGVSTALRALLIAGAIFALAYYWNLESQRVKLWLLRFAPAQRRDGIRAVVDEAETSVGAFLASQLLLGLVIGVASLVAYLLIGLPNAAAVAVLAGAVQLVPWLGALLAVLPLLLVALINNPTVALLGAGYALVVSLVFEFKVQPRYFPRMQTNSLLLLIVAMVLALEMGLAGLILAPAATVALQVLWTHLVEPQRRAAPAAAATAGDLEAGLSQLRETMSQTAQPLAPEAASLVNRLDGLITASKEL
jgi:predicted PurR-regulated permease PerM